VYSLTSYDLWKTTPPDDDGEAWDLYEDRYLPAATRLLVAHVTETLPPALTPRDRAAIIAKVRALVDGLDGESCLAWGNEVAPDEVPDFEAWAQPERPEWAVREPGQFSPAPSLAMPLLAARLAGALWLRRWAGVACTTYHEPQPGSLPTGRDQGRRGVTWSPNYSRGAQRIRRSRHLARERLSS